MPGGAERLLWERALRETWKGLWTNALDSLDMDRYTRPRPASTPPPPPPPFLILDEPIFLGLNGESTVLVMGPDGQPRALAFSEPRYSPPSVFSPQSPPPEDADAGSRLRARDFTVPSFFSQDVLDRGGAPKDVGRLLGLMEDAASGGLSSEAALAPGRGWSVTKEDDDALYLKVAMPGLGKEHVKVWAEQNSVVIKGEGEKEPWDGDKGDAAAMPRYSRRIELTADTFKMDKIKAEMKNGVLRVTVPKVKEEERKDVIQVTTE